MTDLCAYLRIHRSTLYQLVRDRKIPFFRIGADYRFDRQAIDEWRMAQQFPDPATAPRRGPKPGKG
jgi:excisionase family DNA binding protein